MNHETEEAGDTDFHVGFFRFRIGNTKEREGRLFPGLPQRLEGGHLFRLGPSHLHGVGVAVDQLDQGGEGEEGHGNGEQTPCRFPELPLQQVPGGDGGDQQ